MSPKPRALPAMAYDLNEKITVLIVDAAQAPVPKATVVLDQAPSTATSTTDVEGEVSFDNVAPGNHTLLVDAGSKVPFGDDG